MKFVPGVAIASASGSVGGTVFSRNRYGPYTRNRSVPHLVTSDAAIAAKNRLGGLSQDWADLTVPQKSAWRVWAENNPQNDALGQVHILSGHAAFVGVNARVLLAGESQLTVPPTGTTPGGLLTLSMTADIGAGAFELVFTPDPLAAGEGLLWKACVVDSSGISYVNNLLRTVAVEAAATASPLSIETAMGARFGTIQVGQVVHVWAARLIRAKGLLGPFLRTSAVVVSTP